MCESNGAPWSSSAHSITSEECGIFILLYSTADTERLF